MAFLKVLLCFFLIAESTALQQDVQVQLGDDVTLQCQITTDEIISVLKWSRPDLNTDGYVYFYRNKRSYENYQHPSFHGRVKLRDPEMKDGDVSVILKNVTFNDTGIYECHIAVRSKRGHTEISHFINLRVTGETHNSMFEQPIADREHGGGNMHFVPEEETPTVLMVVPAVVPAVVAAVLVVTIGGSVLLWRFKIKKQQTTEAATADLKCHAPKI